MAYLYYNRRYNIYERFGPQGAASFGAMAEREVGTFSRCRRESTARRCARTLFHEAQQLVKGIYSIPLEAWLATFPPEQLLVARLEDYQRSLEAHLQATLAFLGLPPPTRGVWRQMISQKRANRRAPGSTPMHEATRALLAGFYSEFNEHLAALLGDERYLWRDEGVSNSSSAVEPAPTAEKTRAASAHVDRLRS